ncbi:hypothetical protein ACHQM5_018207 [Ranunculus cassubicifolius]
MSTSQSSLNISWHLLLAIASAVILLISTKELPNTPLRAWIIVFAVIHLLDFLLILADRRITEIAVNILRRVSQVFAFVWWIVGVFWILAGGDLIRNNAPVLYWSTAVVLTFRLLAILVSLL